MLPAVAHREAGNRKRMDSENKTPVPQDGLNAERETQPCKPTTDCE